MANQNPPQMGQTKARRAPQPGQTETQGWEEPSQPQQGEGGGIFAQLDDVRGCGGAHEA